MIILMLVLAIIGYWRDKKKVKTLSVTQNKNHERILANTARQLGLDVVAWIIEDWKIINDQIVRNHPFLH